MDKNTFMYFEYVLHTWNVTEPCCLIWLHATYKQFIIIECISTLCGEDGEYKIAWVQKNTKVFCYFTHYFLSQPLYNGSSFH